MQHRYVNEWKHKGSVLGSGCRGGGETGEGGGGEGNTHCRGMREGVNTAGEAVE